MPRKRARPQQRRRLEEIQRRLNGEPPRVRAAATPKKPKAPRTALFAALAHLLFYREDSDGRD